MSRYFFNLEQNGYILEDDSGVDAQTLSDAKLLGLRVLRELISQDALAGKIDMNSVLLINDSEHVTRCRVPYSEAVEILGQH